ncbi:hypothetical protein BDV32DRAFT_145907 [Aspergillus pseudonomiae]|uniref:Uncharacterized protein n=1 Tax=Aspergillus pseudonomiae TaxID=1506151 RepID=A0A5N7DGW4_9EURO|nr:uncharacterized protein BDV37DRAFT_281787 [Aspergillus pseudonomiae]KAB8264128.1 hypothetical protein BDV32DRAFT_145907 [Aspergillus pseudonomiae]KAE8405650.1 hypothetical protein BDV37DRAFT_281787 [Aspergillus pseudonomiae]
MPDPTIQSLKAYTTKAAGKELVLNPGDYIAADLNGVVCSPKKSAQKVQPLMERQVAADEKFSADIKE